DAYLAEQGEALPDTAGELVTPSGKVMGEHGGIHHFTVGQRKGLGVATGSPLYVLEIRGDQKQVVVGAGDELHSTTLRARRINLISVAALEQPMRVTAKIRHRHQPASATAQQTADDEITMTFDQPQRTTTPGQPGVLYAGDTAAAGGWLIQHSAS